MNIVRNGQPVWVYTDREAAHAARKTQKADAWSSNQPPELSASCQVLMSQRPIQTEAGRCLGLRLIELHGNQTLQVLVVNHKRGNAWMAADKALSKRQADAWARFGF